MFGRRAVLCLLLFGLSLALQVLLFGHGFTNQPLNSVSPDSGDALDYTRLGEQLAAGESFRTLFGDGYRLPGYPLFLALFMVVFPEPLLAVRVAQAVLCAAVPAVAILTLPGPAGIVAAGLVAIWVPFHYFSTLLLAESCSLVVLSLFIGALLSEGASLTRGRAVTAAVLLALLIYLKPNHLLLLLPGAVVLLYQRPVRPAAGALARCVGVLVAVMLPWSLFISREAGRFVPLSTTQGLNLYLGTSLELRAGDEATILERPQRNPAAVAAWSGELGARAVGIMRDHPQESLLHGFAKTLHAFGFSLRGARDIGLMIFTLLVLSGSVALWRRREHRSLCLLVWSCGLVAAAQAFLFLPNQRFKTVLFDYPALLLCGCLGQMIWHRLRRESA